MNKMAVSTQADVILFVMDELRAMNQDELDGTHIIIRNAPRTGRFLVVITDGHELEDESNKAVRETVATMQTVLDKLGEG